MRTTFLLFTNRHSACKMAPLGSDSKDHPTAATHLTGGSHTLSARVSHFLTAEHRHKVWLSVFLLLLMRTQVLMRL